MKLVSICIAGLLVVVVGAFLALTPRGRSLVRGVFAEPDRVPDHLKINSTQLNLPLVQPRIEVIKSRRELILYSRGAVVRMYRVGLGSNPTDDKSVQGDGCTPEGEFFVCSKNPKSNYYLSLGLSYPNEEDAERGLRDELISRGQRNQIVDSIRAGECPPWNTRLGGEVFIHGNGSSSDWTLGCVALDNEDIKELYDAIPRGTPVTIKR